MLSDFRLTTVDPFLETNPDAVGSFFSGSSLPPIQPPLAAGVSGFGPGSYTGGYDGGGDRVYWGPYDGSSSSSASSHPPDVTPIDMGPGFVTTVAGNVIAGSAASSTGDTVLHPPGSASQGTSHTASASSTGDTVLNPPSQGTSVTVSGAGTGARGPITNSGISDSVGGPVSSGYTTGSTTTGTTTTGTSGVTSATGTDGTMGGAAGGIGTFKGTDLEGLGAAGGMDWLNEIDPSNLPAVPEMPDLGVLPDPAGHAPGPAPPLSVDDALPALPADPFGGDSTTTGSTTTGSTRSSRVAARVAARQAARVAARGGGSIEMVDLGGGDGTTGTDSVYDGDSYHGDYSEDIDPSLTASKDGTVIHGDASDMEGKAAEIEMQDLGRGAPSLNPELEAYARGMMIKPFEAYPSSEAGGTDSPFLLNDMPEAPPNSVFDFDAIDWRNVDPRAMDAIGDYFESDAGAESSFMSSEGIGQELGMFSRAGFANFLQARVVDFGIGSALAPLFIWLDKATGTPWVSRGIQGTLAVAGLALTGDPFGVIAAPFVWGFQEIMKQNERKLQNDHPDANYGKRYGFVREGHKWYPAYLTRSERDEGWIGSDRTQIRMSYGKDLRFKRQKGTGKMIPYFDDGTFRQKDFHVWDNELDTTNQQSGSGWGATSDPLRDFYFLTEEETTEFLGKLAGGATAAKYADDRHHVFTKEEQDALSAAQKEGFAMMQVHDDVSWEDTWDKYGLDDEQKAYYKQFGQYARTLQDVRSGLELWQDYLTSEPGSIYTTAQDEDEFSGARAFRRAVNDSGYLGTAGHLLGESGGVQKGQMNRPKGSTAAEMQDYALRMVGAGLGGGAIKTTTAEGEWLVEEYHKTVEILYQAQKRAGLSMNFDKLYGDLSGVPDDVDVGFLKPYIEGGEKAASAHFRGSTPESAALHDAWDKSKGSIDKYAWRLYTDGTWEIGDTTTDDGLRDALRYIEASGDSGLIGTNDYRSAAQRDYLATKAYVRYLSNKLDQMGLSEVERKSTDTLGRTAADEMGGYKDFGLDPAYSYADDFAKWGWSTKPHRSKYAMNAIKRAGGGDVGSLRDHHTQDPDFKLSTEDLAAAQEMPTWMRQINQYIIKEGKTPDEVAGRYTSPEDYLKALGIISQRDPKYYAPADEAPPRIATGVRKAWDPYEEGVPEGTMPWDTAQGDYVQPSHKTPGTVYDPVTETYHFPDMVYDKKRGAWVRRRPEQNPPRGGPREAQG